MKQLFVKCAGIIAFVGISGIAVAQDNVNSAIPVQFSHQSSGRYSNVQQDPCPPGQAPIALTPGQPGPLPQGTPAPQGTADTDSLFSGSGGSQNNVLYGNMTVAGTGLTAATGVVSTNVVTPLVLPGLLTVGSTESALPTDRVFFNYAFNDNMRIVTTAALNGSTPVLNRSSGFDLNQYSIGVEKTFLGGRASVYIRVPFLDATDNSAGVEVDGVGDLEIGAKVVLLDNRDAGTLLTAGVTVDANTARNATFPTNSLITSTVPFAQTATANTTINPAFIQPWAAGIFSRDRFFVQEYFGVLVPTDDRITTFINNDVTIGYQLYRNNDCGSILTSVAPTLDLQTLIPLDHEGTSGQFGFSDQLYLTSGVQVGLGKSFLWSAGVVTPIVGPKSFEIGFTSGINFLF